MKVLLSICLFLIVIRETQCHHESKEDYFSANFDEEKNCKHQNLMKKLEKEKKCAEVHKGYKVFSKDLTKKS